MGIVVLDFIGIDTDKNLVLHFKRKERGAGEMFPQVIITMRFRHVIVSQSYLEFGFTVFAKIKSEQLPGEDLWITGNRRTLLCSETATRDERMQLHSQPRSGINSTGGQT